MDDPNKMRSAAAVIALTLVGLFAGRATGQQEQVALEYGHSPPLSIARMGRTGDHAAMNVQFTDPPTQPLDASIRPIDPPIISMGDLDPEVNLVAVADESRNDRPIETYGEAPVDRTPQFLRSVTPLLRPGQWQYDYGFVYALQELDFPIAAGPIPVRTDIRRRSWITPLAVRYGWDRRTQLFANLPVGWADTELATPFEDESKSKAGIGDLTFGVTRLLHQDAYAGKSTIATFRVTAPTGPDINPLFIDGVGLGNGTWRLGADLLCVQSLDPVILFYGLGYSYSFEQRFSGVDVQFGHQALYNLGLGFAANERVTLSTAFLGSYVTESKFNGRRVANSDLEPLRLRLAATIAHQCKLVEPFVTFGLTESAPSAEVGVIWTR